MTYPMFYMMTPTFGRAHLDVVCVHNGHNINVLLGMRRTHPNINFIHCNVKQAFDFLSANGNIGIGCFVPHEHSDENRLRKTQAKNKLLTLAYHAKAWEVYPSVPVVEPKLAYREVMRSLLKLKLNPG